MTVCNGESPAFITAMEQARRLLNDALPAMENHVGVTLPLPTWASLNEPVPSVKTFKDFCVGLLENPSSHTWWQRLANCSLESRTTIAGSLFLLRKVLPVHPSPPGEHHARLTAGPPVLPRTYRRFVTREVHRLLRTGWDRGYHRQVSSFVPSLSSCLERTRAQGGARADWKDLRVPFMRMVDGSSLPSVGRFRAKWMNVDAKGKSRSVTVASSDQVLLGPLHKTIYDYISKETWLLRGEAKPVRFSTFNRKAGEVFVSGDYSAATDNLSTEVAEIIIDCLRKRSAHVPDHIWDYARSSLRCRLIYPGWEADQNRGQLMGNYLSFPLLCLQNYIAFRYFVTRDEVPDDLVRINGDDIVFRSSRVVAERWMSGVTSTGLTLCAGKTLVSSSIFSLNSTFFRALQFGCRRIPVIRWTSLSDVDRDFVPHMLSGGLASFRKGFRGETRVMLEEVYLRYRMKQILATGRSLLRDLRMPVEAESLRRTGLLVREAWMLSVPPCPLPCDLTKVKGVLPEGWHRIPLPEGKESRAKALAHEDLFWTLVCEGAWSTDPVPVAAQARIVWNATTHGGYNNQYHAWRRTKRHAFHLRGEFRRVAKLYRCPVAPVYDFSLGGSVRKVWVPEGAQLSTNVLWRRATSE